ncbi:tripeptidyl peptidase A [Panus rudis PR-1116 ss-1]|nr:tripeptidyl peptidase A [Panus rudis PR-1116 ss-1]
MRVIPLSISFIFAALALAAPSFDSPHKVKETVVPPRGWVKRSVAPRDLTIELRVALPQPNFYELERHLYEISDPDHERYGAHLSKEEIEQLVAPDSMSVESVTEWLASHGVTNLNRSPAGDWIKVHIPVSLAEEMLDTEYHIWVHAETGKTVIRTTAYSLPESLHSHVELVHPTTYFPSTKRMSTSYHWSPEETLKVDVTAEPISVASATNGQVDAACNTEITISCLQQIYNIDGYTPSNKTGSQVGLTGYLEQWANYQDLQSFYAQQRPEAVGSNFTVISVKGGVNNQSEPGVEANLDVQYAYGLAYPLHGTFYTTAGRPPIDFDLHTTENTNEPYLDWVDYVLKQDKIPQVISTSYGDDEQTVPESYARRVCAGLAQITARGVSLLFSSGDFGVGDGDPNPETQICKTNDGRNATRFMPSFPASCPYVTTVGGTFHVPEVAVNFTGGGFSDLFPRPAYQKDAVEKYLAALPQDTYKGLFDPNGRAYPDISAQASRFVVWVGGTSGHVGGTSASSPTIAGIVALLNDARLSHGLPTLGFLNPLIYKIGAENPDALNDITDGNNPGCGTTGFNATKGWDPVTGYGTPNFAKLKDIALAL